MRELWELLKVNNCQLVYSKELKTYSAWWKTNRLLLRLGNKKDSEQKMIKEFKSQMGIE